MFDNPIKCIDCAKTIGTADVTAGERAVWVGEDSISFAGWEAGGAVAFRCPTCAEAETVAGGSDR